MENIYEHLHYFDFTVVILYLIVLLGIGYWISFVKKKKEGENLFLAGKTLKWPAIGLTMWGTNVGPTMLVASAASGFAQGIAAANFSWYAFVFIFFLAMVFAPLYIKMKVSTLPEFVGKRYNGFTRELLAGYSIITIIISWLGMTLFAGGILTSQIMGWPLWVSIVVLVAISAFFAMAGGLEAIAYTNVFQMGLLIVVSLVLTFVGIAKAGGISEVFNSVPEGYWKLFQPNDHPDYPWLAIILGYPVMGIWFWCTDQSMVQSVLGAKNLRQGQLGTNFIGWLKILDMFMFVLPGVLCFLLFPNISKPEEAYATMVTSLLPIGMIGLVMAVLIAALISTIDSALNSLSTIFTLDFYVKKFNPGASSKKVIAIGRLTTLAGAVIGIVVAIGLSGLQGTDLFMYFQSILGFLAPPMAAVFLMGVLWKRITSLAANIVLSVGSAMSILIGFLILNKWPAGFKWVHPFHPLEISFYIFVSLCLIMILISMFSTKKSRNDDMPGLKEAYRENGKTSMLVWAIWAILAFVMIVLYFYFN